jgi:diguanylate cyclase
LPKIKEALSQTHLGGLTELNSLLNSMPFGFIYCKLVFDTSRVPSDYIFLEANHAYKALMGLEDKDIRGKGANKLLSSRKYEASIWLDKFSIAALFGKPVTFESTIETAKGLYEISVFSPRKGYLDRKSVG